MPWILLIGTIVLEVAGTTMMKLSQGLTLFWPSLGVFAFYACALAGIAVVLKEMELSIAYAVWSGAGTALTAVIGIALFGETATVLKVLSLALVVAGIVGLQLAGGGATH